MTKWLFIIWVIGFSSTILASPILNTFTESLNETVKVSGRFHAGLQVNNTVSSDRLFALMPEYSAKQLCVDITSIDGVYRAKIIYDLVGKQKGYVELPFNSQYKSQLLQYNPRDLAIKATIGEDCKRVNNRNVLASWGKDSNSNSLLLLIRSDARRDVAYIPNIANPTHKVKCKKIESSYNVAYDKYCLFEELDLQNVSSIEVERKNLRAIPREKFEIN